MHLVLAYLWMVYFVIHNVLAFFSYISCFFLIYLIKPFNAELFWTLEGFVYEQINRMNGIWLYCGGYDFYESGDDVSHLADKASLLVSNHQNTCDVPSLVAWTTTKEGVSSRVMWIIDVMFRLSHFGIVAGFHRDFFIKSGRERRQQSLQDFGRHLMKNYYPPMDRKWLMLYPEGGFLYKQIRKNHVYAEKNNLPIFHHVALPRTGAVTEIMRTVGEDLEYVIDITMAYSREKDVNFLQYFFPVRPFTVSLYSRVYHADDVPTNEEGIRDWLLELWSEKEIRMAHFAEHKVFPVLPEDRCNRVTDLPLIEIPRRVELTNCPRIALTMFVTVVPGALTILLLFSLLQTFLDPIVGF